MKRLKENHPSHIKFQKLMDCAEELGITLSVSDYGIWTLTDNEWEGKEIQVLDAELNDDRRIFSFPPVVECVLVVD